MSGGGWELRFDWNCTGNYTQTDLLLGPDNTFTTGDGGTGRWAINNNKILLLFDGTSAVYAGDFIDEVLLGVSSTFDGLNGCWYAVTGTQAQIARAPAIAEPATAGAAQAEFTSSGKKVPEKV